MELRRALLLFAIVLGLAAIATSLSRPEQTPRDDGSALPGASDPTAGPGPLGDRPAPISFSDRKPRARRLQAGRPATVTVKVRAPGQVELLGLGLSAPAAPLTPARFEVLERRPGRHEVRYTPAEGGKGRSVGTLRIVRSRG